MDDVTSGFNIGKNISLDLQFNDMVGFTEEEVLEMLRYYKQKGVFLQDIDQTLDLMKEWYDNYKFNKNSKKSVFNTDMILYFVKDSFITGTPPDELIDQNIRIDYGKLRHLVLVSKQLNGNFDRLKSIIEDEEVYSDIVSSFPLQHLTKQENFISLLYYLGLLTLSGSKMGTAYLTIPNRTVKHLMYGYIREALRDTDVFNIDFFELTTKLREMAWLRKWEEFFDFLARSIHQQTAIRDYISAEKVVQGFLLAYLNISQFYISHSEKEMNKGFSDIFLEPFLTKFPDLPYAYLIELKYITRGEMTDSKVKNHLKKGQEQLEIYLKDDLIQKQYASVQTIGIVLVFHGWELIEKLEVISKV